ncbi:MAG TPA: protein-glutamate O-methyltransferase CheR [Rhizomicrobium sp.]
MTPAEFWNLADLVRRRSGLVLTPDKIRFAESKLAPIAGRFGFRKSAELYAELAHPREEIAQAVAEAMTVNDSSFFRDRAPFEHFRDVTLPRLVKARETQKRLRIWCSAIAHGQEAYSLAMMLDDAGLAAQDWKIELVGTDFSAEAVSRARAGVYSQYEVQRGLPIQLLVKYFTQEGENWRVNDRLRHMITFRTFNLLDHFGWLGTLDVIFCRNVLMYFDEHTKSDVVHKMADALAPDGYLVLGDTIGSVKLRPRFEESDLRGIYAKPRAAGMKPARAAG